MSKVIHLSCQHQQSLFNGTNHMCTLQVALHLVLIALVASSPFWQALLSLSSVAAQIASESALGCSRKVSDCKFTERPQMKQMAREYSYTPVTL